jgi:hypothetical protein
MGDPRCARRCACVSLPQGGTPSPARCSTCHLEEKKGNHLSWQGRWVILTRTQEWMRGGFGIFSPYWALRVEGGLAHSAGKFALPDGAALWACCRCWEAGAEVGVCPLSQTPAQLPGGPMRTTRKAAAGWQRSQGWQESRAQGIA